MSDDNIQTDGDEFEHLSGPELDNALQEAHEADEQGDGWVMIGGGQHVSPVQVASSSTPEATLNRVPTPARSERLQVRTPIGSVARSTTSSMTTISRPSPPPSVNIDVTSHPAVIPLDIGDEAPPGTEGQEDRQDGKVDAVFKLHSSRRMKPTSTGRGVSIPSRG